MVEEFSSALINILNFLAFCDLKKVYLLLGQLKHNLNWAALDHSHDL